MNFPKVSRKTSLSIAVAAVLCGLISSSMVYADVGAASVRGQVLQQGNVVDSGTEVTIVNVDSGIKRTVRTSETGAYMLPNLKPGRYKIQVDGSNVASEEFTLHVGQSKSMDLSQQVSSNGVEVEEIVVLASALQPDITSEVGASISALEIERLPQINRNFLTFADQAPGVTVRVDQSDGSVGIRSGAQNAEAVNIFIDGVGQKDYVLKSGITGQDSSHGNPFPQAAIDEYKIISSNYKAEFDQVSSAAITAVTKSGGNELHGGFFYDFTDAGLRKETPNEKENGGKAESEQEQYGFWASGPIIKDKLHFFTSYERKQNQNIREIILNTRPDLVDNYPQFLQDAIRDSVGPTTVAFEEDLFFGKLDWSISDNQFLSASVKYRDEVELTGIGDINTVEYGTDKKTDDTRLTVSHEYWGDGWSNDITFGYEDVSWSPQAATSGVGRKYQIGSTDKISGNILNLGAGPDFQEKAQKGWSFKDDIIFTDISWNGEHAIKAGFSFKAIELTSIEKNPANPQVYYVLDSTDIFDTDTTTMLEAVPYKVQYGQALEGIGNGAAVSKNKQYGLYIQDDWRANDRLELNLGIRWDYEDSPLYTDYETPDDVVAAVTSWSNIENANYSIDDYLSTGSERSNSDITWAPRLGFTYFLTEHGNHTLFGGYGRSYDRNRFDHLQLETTKGTFPRRTIYFSGNHQQPCNDPCMPFSEQLLTDLNVQTATGSREVFMLNNDLEQPYADQYSLGVRSTFGDFSTELGWTRVEARDGFMWFIGNRRPDGSFFEPGATWGVPWGDDIPGDGLSHLLLGTNGLESDRDSFHIKVTKQHDEDSKWGMSVTYTYTDATENRQFGEVFALDYPTVDGFGTRPSSGVSDHVLVATMSYDLPWDIQFAGKLNLRSAAPFYGVDCRDGWLDCKYSQGYQEERRFLIGNWAYRQVDMSLAKNFGFDGLGKMKGGMYVRLDALNVLNAKNYRVVETWFGGAGEVANPNVGTHYGQLAGPTRTLKISAGYNF